MSCTPLRKVYNREVKADMARQKSIDAGVYDEKDIAGLPAPIQRYLRHCGYIGKRKIANGRIVWENAYLKMSADGGWKKISCEQYNSVTEPVRIVYMKNNMLGVFPFEGRDKYQDGHGNMWIKLMGIFTINNARGKEMDESALVTVLAEALFVPGYIFQPYIQWTPIDNNSAKATIRYNDVAVSGVFHINDKGELTSFETDDRNYEYKGTYRKIKWSAVCADYREQNGVKFPQLLTATWHTDAGDYQYFKGKIKGIDFNVKK